MQVGVTAVVPGDVVDAGDGWEAAQVLAAALDGHGTAPQALPQIVAASREVVGENPFTVIFDRGGYDSKLFTWLNEVGIDFITYQRGGANPAAEGFRRREARFEGLRVRMQTSIGSRPPTRGPRYRSPTSSPCPPLRNASASVDVQTPGPGGLGKYAKLCMSNRG